MIPLIVDRGAFLRGIALRSMSGQITMEWALHLVQERLDIQDAGEVYAVWANAVRAVLAEQGRL